MPEDIAFSVNPKMLKVETAAMQAYRAKYPDSPPWQDLSIETRCLWFDYADKALKEPT